VFALVFRSAPAPQARAAERAALSALSAARRILWPERKILAPNDIHRSVDRTGISDGPVIALADSVGRENKRATSRSTAVGEGRVRGEAAPWPIHRVLQRSIEFALKVFRKAYV
jgi:hypothetical protein